MASKLLSPGAGVVSGSALLIGYVLTFTISVASGVVALFSLMPAPWHAWKLAFACCGVAFLSMLNLRGVRESVLLCVPVFFVFLAAHVFAIGYALIDHAPRLGEVATSTLQEVKIATEQVSWFRLLAIILRACSMGAGTYTRIEAVSYGLPILREPRVQTGRRMMLYMGVSLAVTVAGLVLAYLLHDVHPEDGLTLNAVLVRDLASGPSRPRARHTRAVSQQRLLCRTAAR